MWTLTREMGQFWQQRAARRKATKQRLALVTCVRNEASWLPLFLQYHKAVGIERAYVFCDRCTDASASVAAQHAWVRLLYVEPEQAAQFTYIADLHRACMEYSLALAREEGFDWLLIIDPDEFAYGDNPGATQLERAHLLPLIERSRPDTVQIRLATREVVPQQLPEGAPFWRHRYLQRQPSLAWTLVDPLRGEQHTWTGFLGHREGKAFVRTSAAVQGFDSHRWVPDQGVIWPQRPEFAELPTEVAGFHLHYFLSSPNHWIEKFHKQSHEPDVWICGSDVELPKRLLRRVASRLPVGEAAEYFARSIARSEVELAELARQGHIEEHHDVAAMLEGLDREPRGESFCPLAQRSDNGGNDAKYGWTALEMPAHRRQGFFGLERCGDDYFRWAQPAVAVQLRVPPADYRLRIDMKTLHPAWRGRLDISCDDRAIPCRERSIEGGVVRQALRQGDLAPSPFWLKLHFDPIDTHQWRNECRTLGAPIFSIFLDRIE